MQHQDASFGVPVFASFPCEYNIRKILPLVYCLDIETQRKEDSETSDQGLLLWLSSLEV